MTDDDCVGADAFPALHLKFLHPDLVESKYLELLDSPVSGVVGPGGSRQPFRRNGDQFLEEVVRLTPVQRGVAKAGSHRQLSGRKILVTRIGSR